MQVDKITQESLDLLLEMIQRASTATTPTYVKREVQVAVEKNEGVQQLMAIMYDPLIKFNYKVSHEDYCVNYSNLGRGNVDELLNVLNLLYYKTERTKLGKDRLVWDYIVKYGGHLVLFIRKSLDLSFGVSSARDLGIIRAHKPQKGVLCASYDDIPYPTIAEFKYNGSRLSVSKVGDEVTCRLLKGNVVVIPLLEDLFGAMDCGDVTFDGELVKVSEVHSLIRGGLTEADRIWVSGKITSATSTGTPILMEGMHFVVYDLLDTLHFGVSTKTDVPYSERRTRLATAIQHKGTDWISMSMAWRIDDKAQLVSMVNWVKELGGEGLMVKHPNSTYDYRKNKQWYKIKNIKELDMQIIGFTRHTRNPEWIGSLQCKAYLDGTEIRCNVGSGLNDADRPVALFEKYYNRIVMVAYMDVVSNSDGWSITNPRFVKDVVSTPLVQVLRADGNCVNY